MSKHEEHIRDQRSIHLEERDRHQGTDIRRPSDIGPAALQTGGTIYLGRPLVEVAQLRAKDRSVPLLGHSRGGELPGVAERGGHSPGHSGHPVGARCGNRQHFGATCSQVSSKGRRNQREERKGERQL